jgi:hypothetical protein
MNDEREQQTSPRPTGDTLKPQLPVQPLGAPLVPNPEADDCVDNVVDGGSDGCGGGVKGDKGI